MHDPFCVLFQVRGNKDSPMKMKTVHSGELIVFNRVNNINNVAVWTGPTRM